MIIAFSGSSGIGKGFVRERLLRIYPHINELAWFTTRFSRPNEKQGNRIHVSSSEFDKLFEAGDLVLVQNLYSYRYGLKRESLLSSRDIRLTELHPANLKEALGINPAIVTIGFVTSDFSLLYERLSLVRNTESAAEIEQRISAAKIEIESILRQKELFTSIIQVNKASESLIVEQVLAILTPYFEKEGIYGQENSKEIRY